MRILHALRYLTYLSAHIVSGSWRVVRSAYTRGGRARPAIIELPLRCTSDFEISMFASSITITPGTLVLGLAASDGGMSPTLFVHSLYANDRTEVIASLRELETYVLRAVRKGGVA